jgi:outer membrane protein
MKQLENMKQFLTIAILISCCPAFAQTDTLYLTVSKAIEIGVQNRLDLQSLQKNILLTENTLQKGRNQALPELKLIGDIRYNTQLPTTILPKGFAGNNSNLKTQFGTKNNTIASIEYNQIIYSPTFQTDLKILKTNIEIEKSKLKQQQKEAKYSIMQAYYDALLKQKEWEMSRDDKLLTKELLTVAENRYTLGILLENDYLKTKLNYQQKDWEEKKSLQNFTVALDLLKKEMNYNAGPLKLTDEFSDNNRFFAADTSFAGNTEIKQLQLQKQNYFLTQKKAKQTPLPTVTITGNYTTQYQAENFNYFNPWAPYNYVALKIAMPIFSKLNNKSDIKEYSIRQQKSELDIANKKLTLNYEYTNALSNFKNAQYNVDYAKENYALAVKIYETDLQRYKIGKLLYSELINSENNKLKARENLLQSIHDWQLAILKIEKIAE